MHSTFSLLIWFSYSTLVANCLSDFRDRHEERSVKIGRQTIVGHAAEYRSNVDEYLGIPFAQPPVGQLRFAAPQPYTALENSTTFHAKSFSPSCPAAIQPLKLPPNHTPQAPRIIDMYGQQNAQFHSEDCLTLNVWSKGSGKKKPVMAFIYAGAFDYGTTSIPYYNGQYMADDEDVVVVTFNYRLAMFGFPGAPGETQNVGLLDQRMAVEWIRDHVEKFGGDASRITLFGQSAGGISVNYYSFAWTEDPIVNAMISESGVVYMESLIANTHKGGYTQKYVQQAFQNVSQSVGCADSKDELSCIRNVPLEKLLPAVQKYGTSFQPTIDGKVVFANYTKLVEEEKFIKVPHLVGNNDNEYGFFGLELNAEGLPFPNNTQGEEINLADFTCPTSEYASVRAMTGAPTYRYYWMGDEDNLRLYPTSKAYHSCEVPQIFGTAHNVSGIPSTPKELELSKYMMSAWTSFAKYGAEAPKKLGWPQYDKQKNTLIVLGSENKPGAKLISPKEVDKGCSKILSKETKATSADQTTSDNGKQSTSSSTNPSAAPSNAAAPAIGNTQILLSNTVAGILTVITFLFF